MRRRGHPRDHRPRGPRPWQTHRRRHGRSHGTGKEEEEDEELQRRTTVFSYVKVDAPAMEQAEARAVETAAAFEEETLAFLRASGIHKSADAVFLGGRSTTTRRRAKREGGDPHAAPQTVVIGRTGGGRSASVPLRGRSGAPAYRYNRYGTVGVDTFRLRDVEPGLPGYAEGVHAYRAAIRVPAAYVDPSSHLVPLGDPVVVGGDGLELVPTVASSRPGRTEAARGRPTARRTVDAFATPARLAAGGSPKRVDAEAVVERLERGGFGCSTRGRSGGWELPPDAGRRKAALRQRQWLAPLEATRRDGKRGGVDGPAILPMLRATIAPEVEAGLEREHRGAPDLLVPGAHHGRDDGDTGDDHTTQPEANEGNGKDSGENGGGRGEKAGDGSGAECRQAGGQSTAAPPYHALTRRFLSVANVPTVASIIGSRGSLAPRGDFHHVSFPMDQVQRSNAEVDRVRHGQLIDHRADGDGGAAAAAAVASPSRDDLSASGSSTDSDSLGRSLSSSRSRVAVAVQSHGPAADSSDLRQNAVRSRSRAFVALQAKATSSLTKELGQRARDRVQSLGSTQLRENAVIASLAESGRVFRGVTYHETHTDYATPQRKRTVWERAGLLEEDPDHVFRAASTHWQRVQARVIKTPGQRFRRRFQRFLKANFKAKGLSPRATELTALIERLIPTSAAPLGKHGIYHACLSSISPHEYNDWPELADIMRWLAHRFALPPPLAVQAIDTQAQIAALNAVVDDITVMAASPTNEARLHKPGHRFVPRPRRASVSRSGR